MAAKLILDGCSVEQLYKFRSRPSEFKKSVIINDTKVTPIIASLIVGDKKIYMFLLNNKVSVPVLSEKNRIDEIIENIKKAIRWKPIATGTVAKPLTNKNTIDAKMTYTSPNSILSNNRSKQNPPIMINHPGYNSINSSINRTHNQTRNLIDISKNQINVNKAFLINCFAKLPKLKEKQKKWNPNITHFVIILNLDNNLDDVWNDYIIDQICRVYGGTGTSLFINKKVPRLKDVLFFEGPELPKINNTASLYMDSNSILFRKIPTKYFNNENTYGTKYFNITSSNSLPSVNYDRQFIIENEFTENPIGAYAPWKHLNFKLLEIVINRNLFVTPIFIITYNRFECLKTTLTSFEKYITDPFEVVFIDNGTTYKPTLDYINDYISKNESKIYWNNVNNLRGNIRTCISNWYIENFSPYFIITDPDIELCGPEKILTPNLKNKSPNFKNKSPNFKNKSPNEVGGNISGGNISGGNISGGNISVPLIQLYQHILSTKKIDSV